MSGTDASKIGKLWHAHSLPGRGEQGNAARAEFTEDARNI